MDDFKRPLAPAFFLWLGIIICAAALIRLWPERGYYFLPQAQRALHPHHELLRSSGKYGLTFGAVGTLLLFINLTYLIRKQLIGWAWLGSLRSWMAFHVFTGLVAGAMVLLHSTLLLRSALGTLAFCSMIIVLITGLVGRYIYAHTPRSLKGKELEIEEIRWLLSVQRTKLESMGMPPDFFDTTMKTSSVHGSDKSILSTLFSLAAGDRELRREQQKIRQMIQSRPSLRAMAKDILPLTNRYCQERQWLARYQELRSLMGGWRFFHRWIAILLLCVVSFHIFISFQMGNLWLADDIDRFLQTYHWVGAPPPALTPSVEPLPARPLFKPFPPHKKKKNRNHHP
jgi:dihydropyrimidine dehydrogenase (NAD+) subunit PreT